MADVQRTPRELLEARGEFADEIVAVLVDGKIVDLHTPVADGAASTTTSIAPTARSRTKIWRGSRRR